jgi:hypothetical protein
LDHGFFGLPTGEDRVDAAGLTIHHKTVSKIIDAAENHRQRLRVAV